MTVSSTQPKATTIPLPATGRKGFGRDAHWTVSVLGLVNGHGATLADAKASAAQTAHDIISNCTSAPAFAIDDDGSTIVAVAQGSGTAIYRWPTEGRPSEVSYRDGSPADAVASVSHWTVAR